MELGRKKKNNKNQKLGGDLENKKIKKVSDASFSHVRKVYEKRILE